MLSVFYSFLRIFYTVIFTIGIPVVLLRLWWKGRKNPGYRQRISERFGFFSNRPTPGGLWVHTVSVGEFLATVPLIRALQKRFPDLAITVTTTTPTGSAQVQKVFGDQVFHVYFPYDIPWCLNRFLNRIQPSTVIIVETELWPNCLDFCQKRQLPVLIVSGRLSQHSFKGYKRLGFIMKEMLAKVGKVAAQSDLDGQRFIELGLDPNRLLVTGNIKFDLTLKDGLQAEAQCLREGWGGETRFVLIAASTHAKEEEQILLVFDELKKKIDNPLLIIVPRHPERFPEVIALLKKRGDKFVQRSTQQTPSLETEIYMGDTMGELPLLYAASDVAFVGGSLVSIGGHNVLEASALGLPVVVGPYTHNFVDIVAFLRDAGALVQVQEQSELTDVVLNWFVNVEARKHAGSLGQQVIEKNRGAVAKIINLLEGTT